MNDVSNEKSYIGQLGETAAAKYLKKKGYIVVGSNVREGHSEIDIIAAKDRVLVFVEVKTRTYVDGEERCSRPADAVNKSKISYLIRGADRFCAENAAKYAGYFKRFDIIEVYISKSPNKYKISDIKHFENTVRR